jgi:hypothetical protein
MVSAQFRAAVSTVPGLFAIVLVTVSAVLVVLNPSVTLVVGFWILLVGLWVVYLLSRLVAAVETVVEQDSRS